MLAKEVKMFQFLKGKVQPFDANIKPRQEESVSIPER